MSTEYRTREPMSKAEWTEAAEAAGWHRDTEAPNAVVNENEPWTDGENWVWCTFPQVEGAYVAFTRYGRNDANSLVEAVDAVSEYDDEFWAERES